MENYISKFSIQDIIEIESKDLQFIALQKARNKIKSKTTKDKIINQNLFLFLIIQNWIISYQIAWSWEKWREEFSEKIIKERDKISDLLINNKNNIERRYNFLTTSKYNKRIYNIKKSRLIKLNKFLDNMDRNDKNIFENHYKDMEWLLTTISEIMNRPKDSKTLTFTIKMFWYWSRIVFDNIIYYPHTINIPIDSRLKKIYETNLSKKIWNKKSDLILIKKFFSQLSKKHNIAPLHLDSILRIKYRKNEIKKRV